MTTHILIRDCSSCLETKAAGCDRQSKANPPLQNPTVGVSTLPLAKGEIGHREIRTTTKGDFTNFKKASLS